MVVDVAGIGYKVFLSLRAYPLLPLLGETIRLFTYLNVRENALELFGFAEEAELNFFEKLLLVNGVGPRSALGIIGVASVDKLVAAIDSGKVDLLTRATGIGKKTAERIVLELQGKLAAVGTKETVKTMEADLELEEALVSLGYNRNDARKAIAQISSQTTRLEDRLKKALQVINKS